MCMYLNLIRYAPFSMYLITNGCCVVSGGVKVAIGLQGGWN